MFRQQMHVLAIWLAFSIYSSHQTFVVSYVPSRMTNTRQFHSTTRRAVNHMEEGTRLISASYHLRKVPSSTVLEMASPNGGRGGENQESIWEKLVTSNLTRSFLFSILMASCGALLGPFLDSYHSAFGVLKYDEPIKAILWGNEDFPALTTAWWVPELFGLAGFLIGWLYIIFDEIFKSNQQAITPGPSKTLIGISVFTLQYWISGVLFQSGIDRTTILNTMSVIASIGFLAFDGTTAGLITSAATALGGPLIEAGLIWSTAHGYFPGGYHYNDLGETGFFPLWIIPVYFLGGPANGNLARSFWNALSNTSEEKNDLSPCPVCNDSRRVPCPNCNGIGTYVAMGGRTVKCTSCNGRGFVICRACFDRYDEDPYDIDSIRELMNRMPD